MSKHKGCSPISYRLYRSSIFRFFMFIFCVFIPFEIFLMYFIERMRIYFGYKPAAKPVQKTAIIPVESIVEVKTMAQKPVQSVKPAVKTSPDNLEDITGIGKKTAEILNESGITTFAQLAKMGVEDINAILSAAGSRVKANQSWIDQAKGL